jgi:hypothetical protein
MALANGQVSVSTSAVLVTNITRGGCVVVNTSASQLVYLGGPSVATSGANQGIPLAANASIVLPSFGSLNDAVYAIAGAAATVNFLVGTT